MKSAIAIVTHRSGIPFLENLLRSFKSYYKYNIVLVISEFRTGELETFSNIRSKFDELPIEICTTRSNSFEFGGVYSLYEDTDYDEFLLLSHSCEIINTDLFDIVFEENRGRSVAFSIQQAHWGWIYSEYLNRRNQDFVSKHLEQKAHDKLVELGTVSFWHGHLGKYRRAILDKMNLGEYLPRNMIEAVVKSELLFTSNYNDLDPNTVVLFPDWEDGKDIREKFGKKRLRLGNQYIIKWKTHWTIDMVLDDMKSQYVSHRIKRMVKNHLNDICNVVRKTSPFQSRKR